MTITKDTIIGDILNIAPQTAPLFMGDRHALPGLPLPPAGGAPGGGPPRAGWTWMICSSRSTP